MAILHITLIQSGCVGCFQKFDSFFVDSQEVK